MTFDFGLGEPGKSDVEKCGSGGAGMDPLDGLPLSRKAVQM